jgi:hypothetical protein
MLTAVEQIRSANTAISVMRPILLLAGVHGVAAHELGEHSTHLIRGTHRCTVRLFNCSTSVPVVHEEPKRFYACLTNIRSRALLHIE